MICFAWGKKNKDRKEPEHVSLLGVLVCLLKDELVGLIDRINEFPRPPGHIGSLAL